MGSFWQPLADVPPLDFLVSNPPYVDPARPELLAENVRRFEPGVALFTDPGEPGRIYQRLVEGTRDHLKSGGRLFLETGVGADTAALQVLESSPHLVDVALLRDDAGLPRYLLARRR